MKQKANFRNATTTRATSRSVSDDDMDAWPEWQAARGLKAPDAEAPVAAPESVPAVPVDASAVADAPPAPSVYSIAQVARLFGRQPRTIRAWIAVGRLPVLRIGRTPFIPVAALDAMLQRWSWIHK